MFLYAKQSKIITFCHVQLLCSTLKVFSLHLLLFLQTAHMDSYSVCDLLGPQGFLLKLCSYFSFNIYPSQS